MSWVAQLGRGDSDSVGKFYISRQSRRLGALSNIDFSSQFNMLDYANLIRNGICFFNFPISSRPRLLQLPLVATALPSNSDFLIEGGTVMNLTFKHSVMLSSLLLLPMTTAQAISFTDVGLGTAGISGLNLGIFVTGATTINSSNSGAYFNTNLGLASGASTNFSGAGTLTGALYKDPSATVQSNIASQLNVLGGISTQSLSQAVTDVQSAASNASSLSADATYSSIGSSATTFNAIGALNVLGGHNTVIDVTGGILITNASNSLTINGNANDYFIINVGSGISVTSGAIALSGGVTPDHVLFNLEGGNLSLTNSTSTLNGTFLAVNNGQMINVSPGTVNGALIGYQIQTSSSPMVNGYLYTTPVPEPTEAAMLLAGLGLVGWMAARRKTS